MCLALSIAARALIVLGVLVPWTSVRAEESSEWMPSYVAVTIDELANGDRFVRMMLFWETAPAFPEHATFELDVVLNNYEASPLGPGTYLDRAERWDQTPRTQSWKSELPASYLDTRFADIDEEVAYTIGSGDAASIEPGILYTSLIVLRAGDADVDSAKVVAHRGEQRPAGCTSTWCSFGLDEADANVTIVPAWEMVVPGMIEWGTRPPSVATPAS